MVRSEPLLADRERAGDGDCGARRAEPGRNAATMASDLTADEHERATAAQAESWEKLLNDVMGGSQDEPPEVERGPPGIRRAPRIAKSRERSPPVVPTFGAVSQGFQYLGVTQPPQLVKSG
jgi:hypothetical protein